MKQPLQFGSLLFLLALKPVVGRTSKIFCLRRFRRVPLRSNVVTPSSKTLLPPLLWVGSVPEPMPGVVLWRYPKSSLNWGLCAVLEEHTPVGAPCRRCMLLLKKADGTVMSHPFFTAEKDSLDQEAQSRVRCDLQVACHISFTKVIS